MMCAGKAFKPSQAVLVARCEALERYLTIFQSPTCSLIYGSQESLQEEVVDPRLLFFDAVRQRTNDKRAQYAESLPMYWTCATEMPTYKPRLVPAQEIWFNTDRFENEHLCVTNTTNACAVGQCLEEAALFALFEAIERDAFLTTWYLRRSCASIDASCVAFEPFQLLWGRLRMNFTNYRFTCFDIASDVSLPSVMVVADRVSGSGPRMLLSAATHLFAERALFSAIKDLGVSLSSHVQDYQSGGSAHLLTHPEEIENPDEHRELYSLDEPFERMNFLDFDAVPTLTCEDLNGRSWFEHQECFRLKEVLESLGHRLAALGVSVLMKDISHPDLAAKGLRCVKAIGVGLYPMWFGHYGMRFAVTPRLKRLAASWGRPLTGVGDINLDLHPFD